MNTDSHGSKWRAGLVALVAFCACSAGADPPAVRFRKEVQPVLSRYCFDCHGDGSKRGGVSLDRFKSDDHLLNDHKLWWAVLKNLRTGIMPPAGKARPSAKEQEALERWVKYDAFGINPKDPDPGRVTIRRLNRVEYRNTIRDLMGVAFNTDEEFPPDDTGYGFDTIGDVLTVSPLLLEKYLRAATTIVAAAVPTVSRVIHDRRIPGADFRAAEGNERGDRLTFYKKATVAHTVPAERAGDYRIRVEMAVPGQFDFDPGRCRLVFTVDGSERWRQELGWQSNKPFSFQLDEKWEPGQRRLAFQIEPLTPIENKRNPLVLRILSVSVQGPLAKEHWVHPPNYKRFFTRDEPPAGKAERRLYAREVLARFARKAYRRPVDDRTINRLVALAERGYDRPGQRFEEGITQAMVAVLGSPRFLFRVEAPEPTTGKAHPFVDEHALASRLSYFLWSSMPDEELFGLADRGQLRKELPAQVKRMLNDPRSEALIQNFTGQWLQARDVEGIAINSRAVLAREGRRVRFDLTRDLRRAMRLETELCFSHVVRQDRSVLELIDSDYTFLNEALAEHYGIAGVTGKEMRRVSLPKDSPRGGVLTQATVLLVTSNPTRTSPVKRGLFILDNILGTPAPPPPGDVPELEEAEKQFKDRRPTIREAMELHRSQPLCRSCHARMDPLGLALENFNALGMFRQAERGQTIDPSGRLITGEAFKGIGELKKILVSERKADFLRCLTEKLLTYALGRGLDHRDVETVDRIVERLGRENARFSALLAGIIESAPFQKVRRQP